MKTLILTFALSASAWAQGTILFSNLNIPSVNGIDPPYRAGIYRDNRDRIRNNSTIGAGAGFTAGLFLASNLSTPLATTTFRLNDNTEIFADNTQEVNIPGVQAGSSANLVVRAWSTAGGSYDNVRNSGNSAYDYGEQAFTSRALGGPNPVPGEPAIFTPGMTGFTGFEMSKIPEPSTLALAAVGFGALALRRRVRGPVKN